MTSTPFSTFDGYTKLFDACKIKYAIIADQGYLQQVGGEDIKKLMSIDNRAIADDIKDVASLDATALVARIEEAFTNNSWDDAKDLWAYMKSRRTKLSADLDDAQKAAVYAFMKENKPRIYISCVKAI